MKQRLCCSRTESFNSFFYIYHLVGRGGPLVDSMPLDRKVVGSNPILAATPGTLGKSFTNSIHYIIYCRASQTVGRYPQVGPGPLPRGSQECFMQRHYYYHNQR